MLKALAQQERQSTRSRHRDAHAGPRDDLDLEMDALLLRQQQSNPGCAPLIYPGCHWSCAPARHEHSSCQPVPVGKSCQMLGKGKRAAQPQVACSSAERISPKGFQPHLQGLFGRRHGTAPARASFLPAARRAHAAGVPSRAGQRPGPGGARHLELPGVLQRHPGPPAGLRGRGARGHRPGRAQVLSLECLDGSRAWHHRDQRCATQ